MIDGRSRPPRRTLYFDIDGTVTVAGSIRAKAGLAGGALERALRDAGFKDLVCVGSLVQLIHLMDRAGRKPDAAGMVFEACAGAFEDQAWFRGALTLAVNSNRRVSSIDKTRDWFYADDLARHYCAAVGMEHLVDFHEGKRILVPRPDGDGSDVLAWIRSVAGRLPAGGD